MRIRKRKVPLPLSLLSPVPLSDPNLFTRSPVALHLHHHQHHPQPSDHFPPASSPPSDLITPGTHSAAEQRDYKHKEQQEDEGEGEEKSCLEFQGGGGGERVLSQQRSIHHNDDVDDDTSKQEEPKAAGAKPAVNNNEGGGGGRWSEGERVMPLKKRRPSSSEPAVVMVDDGPNNNVQNMTKKGGGGGNGNGNNNGKQKRGTMIMEGSRCSRVNGRGWRCCQPTLVGYSLCEHHLGKGRLRSMTTVRGRPAAPKKPPKVKNNDDNNNNNNNNNNSTKRVNYKLGVVKARSLSSLLGQTTTETARITTTDDNSNAGCVDQ